MTLNKTRIGIVLVAVILVFSLLTLVFWPFVRDTIIVPIYYVLWVGDLFLKSVPQEAFLAILILICLVIGVNTLMSMRVRRFTSRIEDMPFQSDSRYTYWRNVCSNLGSSPFAQDTFTWEARKMILSIFAYQNGVETTNVEEMIKSGSLSVPAPIKMLIQERKIRYFEPASQPSGNIILRLRGWLFPVEEHKNPPIDSPIAEIIDYIEHLLEIDHARK